MNFNDIHENDEQMDQLFSSARNQAPKHSFSAASSAFTGAMALGVSTAAHAKVMTSSIFKSKIIIMSVSTTTLITASALIYSAMQSPSSAKNEASFSQKKTPIPETEHLQATETTTDEAPFVASFQTNSEFEIAQLQVKNYAPILKEMNRGEVKLLTVDNPEGGEARGFKTYNYTLTENTTKEELEEIKRQAEVDGIKFVYSARIRNGNIKNLKLTMRSQNGSVFRKIHINKLIRNPHFFYELEWEIDKEGQLVSRCMENDTELEFDNPSEAEIEQFDAEMAKQDEILALQEPLFERMDSLLKKLDIILLESEKYTDLITLAAENEAKYAQKQIKLEEKTMKRVFAQQENEKYKTELAELIKKTEQYGAELSMYMEEMNRIDIQIAELSDEIDGISQEIDALDLEMYWNEQIDESTDMADSIMLNSVSKPTGITTVKRLISNLSKEEDLYEIQKAALKAGIDFQYTAQIRKGRIKSIQIKMTITDDEGFKMINNYNLTARRKEMFSFPVSWRQDESGRAIDFGNPNQVKVI